MLQSLCVGWILGLAMMGRSLFELEFTGSQVVFMSLIWLSIVYVLKQKNKAVYFKCCIAVGSIIFGFFIGYGYANQALEQRLKHVEYASKQIDVIAYIRHLDRWNTDNIQQPIEVIQLDGSSKQWLASIKNTQISSTDFPEFKLGQYYRIHAEIRPAHSYATAGAFDIEKWYIEQNIMAGLRIKTAEQLSQEQVKALGYSIYLNKQQAWTARFALFVESKRVALRSFIIHQPIREKGLILALLTGDQSLLSPQTKQQFQRFGMSHLLAISGPHVIIFALMVCGLLKLILARYFPKLYLKYPRQYLLCLPFLSCVFLYCAFVGFEIPAMRTLLITSIVCLAILLKQQIQAFKLLSYSAALLLLFDPFSILSAAFWLSYGACFVLLRIYQTIQQQKEIFQTRRQKLRSKLKILLESQWKIFVGLFPLMIIFFKQVAWITPISNLFAIPWLGLVVVPLDILAALLFFIFEPLSSLVFQLNDLCVQVLLALVNFTDQIFVPKLIPVPMSIGMLVLCILALFIVFLPRGVVPKAWSLAVVFPILTPADSGIELNILDVAQGQSIFIQDQSNNLMVDTGGYYDENKFSIGRQVIQPFLAVNGISKLNHLLLTHLDQDHSGAYEYIKDDLKVEYIYANEPIDVNSSSQFHLCHAGMTLNLSSNIQIKVLSPRQNKITSAGFNKNENSCVLHVFIPNKSPYQYFLLMGDAGWQTEFELMQRYPNMVVDVLVLGHHGSHNSSAYDFLSHYQPKLAIASAGRFNRYGHPSQLTQARLDDLNIPLFTTAAQGSIRFKMQDSKLQVEFYRDRFKWLKRQ